MLCPLKKRIIPEGGGIIMSRKGKTVLFSFLRAFFFTLLLTLGVVFSYLKSFLPDTKPGLIFAAAIISAALFSFLFQMKKKLIFGLISLSVIVLFLIIRWKTLIQSAGSTFLPLYASYKGDLDITKNYSFSESPLLFIIFFVIIFSLLTSSVIMFCLPSIFSLAFSFVVILFSIAFSQEFIDPFSFMLLVSSSAVLLIERRGLIHVGPGAAKPAVISAIIFLLLSLILNAAIKPATYVQNENVKKARLSLEDFILDHTGFYVDVNTGNLMFGSESSNTYSWVRDERYADISGGALLRNNRPVMKMDPPESYPYYIKINEYTDYDGSGWAKGPKGDGEDRYEDFIRIPPATAEALIEKFDELNRIINRRIEIRLNSIFSDGTNGYPIRRDNSFISSTEGFEYINVLDLITDTVKEYVSNAAVYDKGIEKPPKDTDIVSYFLNESKKGYCIHFASAATLLLRGHGIPARFVTGYMITERETGPDGKIEVRGDDGHAWCEYYDFNADLWRILDATPADPSQPASVASSQNRLQDDDLINPSGEVDDSDMDDIDDDEGDEEEGDDTSSSETESKEPQDNGQAEYNRNMAEKGRNTWILIISVAAIILALLLSVVIGKGIYKGNLLRGNAKQRILKYYRAIKLRRKWRLIKTVIPDDVKNTVMKARFSDHEMTKEELNVVKNYYESLLSASG